MIDSIQFGSQTIQYTIQYSDRKTLGITITPETKVLVKAPANASRSKIKEKVTKRASWIIRQQSYFLTFHPKTPPRKYVSGESHLYLGRQYRLKVTISKKEEVRYKGRYIEVYVKKKERAKKLLIDWYRYRAKIKFAEIAEPLIARFKKYDVEPSGVYLQNMKYRWGSCTPGGKVILNPELIKAPKPCIEYVIIHELCHLIYRDHTRKFLELQTREMPDWKKWKEKLEKLLA